MKVVPETVSKTPDPSSEEPFLSSARTVSFIRCVTDESALPFALDERKEYEVLLYTVGDDVTVVGDPFTPFILVSFTGVLGRLIRPGDML